MFPIAIGAIDLPVRGWRGAGAIHCVTIAGWAHVGNLGEELVDVYEEYPVVFAKIVLTAIERFSHPFIVWTNVFEEKKES